MSAFIGMASQVGSKMVVNDDRLHHTDYKSVQVDQRDPNVSGVNFLWPRSSFQGAQNGMAQPLITEAAHQMWEWDVQPTGGHVRTRVTGVTRNNVGAPLGGATVQLFNTSTGLLVDTVTSDSAGNYTASDPNAVACFAVAYEAGSPDVAGTTKNNITGT
jgi:hypothetical protein